ncbi:MAG: exodeoxyribonuclease V subunit gamma [Lachnospiraceae bacterium]|nr:exodeoxyribonuclease V subunit gamma [Lachnospiraceae bacterium]
MALKFWLGGAKSDRSHRLYKYILDEADLHPERQYLVVVPEQFGLATQRELVLGSKNCGILNIDVLSFSRLAHRIRDEVGAADSDATMLDDMGKSLIIGMLALKKQQDLTVLAKNIDKLGYIDKIKSVISEFMQYRISPEKAGEMADAAKTAGRGLLAEKLSDVTTLYSSFKDYIKDKYTTTEETLESVCRLIPKSQTVKCSEIVFDGFTGFNPVQNNLIGTLMEYAINVHISLVLDDCIQEYNNGTELKEHELFYLSKNTMNQLGRIADERRITILDSYKSQEFGINNTQDKIVYTKGASRWKLNNTSVHIMSGQNPEEEIRMVFTKIMDLVRNEAYHYRDVAVVTGDTEGYRHIIERCFGIHGIPFFIDTAEPILLNPFIEYTRAFLAVICENYSTYSVFRFLKSGLAGFSEDEIDTLENYCLAAGIKGRKAWHVRFDAHTQSVGADELIGLNSLRESFIAKTDLFAEKLGGASFNAGSLRTVRQFAEALYIAVEAEGIEEKLKKASEDFEKAGNTALSEQYKKIYVKIMDILDELCALIPDEKMDIRGFSKLLDAGLDSIRIGMLPKGMDYVQVGDLTRSRLNDIKALFIVGAVDGVIPKIAEPAGIINESDREFLTDAVKETHLAPTAKEDMFSQQLYVYMAINRPSERLYVSYPRVSSAGRSVQPSYITKKLAEADPSVRIETMPLVPEYYTDAEEAFEELTGLIVPAITGALPPSMSERTIGLARFFLSDENYRPRLLAIFEREILNRGKDANDSIGAALAHAIYGKRIATSITRLETYAKCAYRYFLEYALKLRERELFSFESKDMGTIFHDSMKVYSELMTKNGSDWADITEDERNRLMDEAVNITLEQYRPHKLSSSARNAYMENRIRSIMRKSADIVSLQLKSGKFQPKYFEVDFDSMTGDALSIRLKDDELIRLRGRIDRVDTCEKDDGVYVRIIDYKSSKHDMNLAAVYEGRQLQLLVYLNAAEALERKRIGAQSKKEVVPAGVFYYKFDDPLIEADGELSVEEIRKLVMKQLHLNGLASNDVSVLELMDEGISDDSAVLGITLTKSGEVRKSKQALSPDDFSVLGEYVTKAIKSMGEDIMSGNIGIPVPDSCTRFTEPDCGFCPYGSVCINKGRVQADTEENGEDSDGIDEEEGGTQSYKKITNDEWIEKMRTRDFSASETSSEIVPSDGKNIK